MRRLWAATAAIVVCLTFGGMSATAQEASAPTGPSIVETTLTCTFSWAASAYEGSCKSSVVATSPVT